MKKNALTLRNLLEAQGFDRIGLKKLLSGHYRLQLKVNGKPASFILDTGASASCIGYSRVDRFELQAENSDLKATGAGTSQLETRKADNVSLVFSKDISIGANVILFDLSHVNEALDSVGEAEVDGILGAELLKHYRAVIDYGRNAIYLKRKAN